MINYYSTITKICTKLTNTGPGQNFKFHYVSLWLSWPLAFWSFFLSPCYLLSWASHSQLCLPQVHLWLSPMGLTLSALTGTGSSILWEGCTLNLSHCLEEPLYHSWGVLTSWQPSSWTLLPLTQVLRLSPAWNSTSLWRKVEQDPSLTG